MSDIEKTFEQYFMQLDIPYTHQYVGFNVEKKMPNMYEWRVSIGDFTTSYYMGVAHGKRQPTITKVMYSLLNEASMGEYSFEDFCSELGYNEDSRKAHATWQACQEIAERFKLTFSEEQLETMRDLLQDY